MKKYDHKAHGTLLLENEDGFTRVVHIQVHMSDKYFQTLAKLDYMDEYILTLNED